MREFQEKRRLKKIVYSRWSFLALFAVFVFLAYSVVRVYMAKHSAETRAEEIKKKLTGTETRIKELENEIARLESSSGLEEELRKQFNMAKPGEKSVLIVDKIGETDKISGEEKNGSFFRKILDGIKKIFK